MYHINTDEISVIDSKVNKKSSDSQESTRFQISKILDFACAHAKSIKIKYSFFLYSFIRYNQQSNLRSNKRPEHHR